MDPRFIRTSQLLGNDVTNILARTKIAVFGLGGVGAYVIEALARSGIGYLRLIDFDDVQLSNFNRQLFALDSTLSKKKVDVARERVRDINPSCIVETKSVFVDRQSVHELLAPPVDVVIDAIDSVSSKVALLATSFEKGYPTISSMGAAARIDPLAIRVGDIDESRMCPLAKIIRKRLHRLGIYSGIRCVYSIEPVSTPDVAIMDTNEQFSRGRPRPSLGSISYLTGMFGLTIAYETIRLITLGINENTSISNGQCTDSVR